MTIYNFKKGDSIVRTHPSKPYNKNMELFGEPLEVEGRRDRSYLGEELIFVGVSNGQVYLQRTDEFSKRVFGDKLLRLSLDIWDEGWDYYTDPNKLFKNDSLEMDKTLIEEQIKKAIENEDYELANKLKLKLKD